jgi:hypothetical protein
VKNAPEEQRLGNLRLAKRTDWNAAVEVNFQSALSGLENEVAVMAAAEVVAEARLGGRGEASLEIFTDEPGSLFTGNHVYVPRGPPSLGLSVASSFPT